MKKGSTLFLKTVLFLIAMSTVIGLFCFPQTEGRAAHLNFINIYMDPFIIYIYIGSIPFFMALYQAFKLLGYIEKNKVFSPLAVRTLRTIRYCAIAIVGFLVVGIILIRVFAHGDDSAGPTGLGMIISFVSIVIATAAAIFERLLQNAVDLKSENDLTV